jgi:hypothetical protein
MLQRFHVVVVVGLAAMASINPLTAQTFCEAASPAAAPTCSRVTTLSATVSQVLRLELSTLTTAMAPPDLPQFDSTRLAASLEQLPLAIGPEVTVISNRPWNLKIAATSQHFSFTPDAVYQLGRVTDKSVTDVAWSTAPNSGFVPLSATTPVDVRSNPAGGSYEQFTMYYRTKWLLASDIPGTYAISISYTLTGL